MQIWFMMIEIVQLIELNFGFEYIVIWEDDFLENKDSIIFEVLECIKKKAIN